MFVGVISIASVMAVRKPIVPYTVPLPSPKHPL